MRQDMAQRVLGILTESYADRIRPKPPFKDGTVYGFSSRADPAAQDPGVIAVGRHWGGMFECPIEAMYRCIESLDAELARAAPFEVACWRKEPTINLNRCFMTEKDEWIIRWRLTFVVLPDHPFAVEDAANHYQEPEPSCAPS